MHRYFSIVLFFIPLVSLRGNSISPSTTAAFLEVNSKEDLNAGMFSMFFSVLHALFAFENGQVGGVAVNFKETGCYYDSKHGPNWWQYYLEPIYVNEEDRGLFKMQVPHDWGQDSYYPRMLAYQIIEKHIHPKAHILDKLNAFYDQHFAGNDVIGIHYRGTDKSIEAPRVEYAAAMRQVEDLLQSRRSPNPVKLFIATDEEDFIHHAAERWGDSLCYLDTPRSSTGKALHTDPHRDPYQVGEDALLDMLLLSKCDILVRCRSNLSLWSGYFNPWMEVIDLNKHYCEE